MRLLRRLRELHCPLWTGSGSVWVCPGLCVSVRVCVGLSGSVWVCPGLRTVPGSRRTRVTIRLTPSLPGQGIRAPGTPCPREPSVTVAS